MVIDLFGLTDTQVRDHFPAVYQHILGTVKPERDENARPSYRDNWWIFGEPRGDLRPAITGLPRYIATVETSKHGFFQFLDASIRPDNMLVAVGLAAPESLAILSSRLHVAWSLRIERLDAFRKERIAAHPHLTMTGLYNALERFRELDAGAPVEPLSDAERDTHEAGQTSILKDLHDRIDRAVLDAYGWGDLAPALVGKPGGTTPSPHKTPEQEAAEEELLIRLVALNKARAAEEARGDIKWLRPEFQILKLRGKAPQPERAEQIEADIAPAVASAGRLAWPGDGLDQIRTLRAALTEAAAPLTAPELNARFKEGSKRGERLSELLSYMVETGMIRQDTGEGPVRYFVPQ